jgi:hypothetical protein
VASATGPATTAEELVTLAETVPRLERKAAEEEETGPVTTADNPVTRAENVLSQERKVDAEEDVDVEVDAAVEEDVEVDAAAVTNFGLTTHLKHKYMLLI